MMIRACPVPGCGVDLSTEETIANRCSAGHKWWAPNAGPQTQFMASECQEILYGGQAGGGKTAALAMLPLRWCHEDGFQALILRREATQLTKIIDEQNRWYQISFPDAGSKHHGAGIIWEFDSSAKVRLAHCKTMDDAYKYQGEEFQLVCYDELTHFEEEQYLEVNSRIRSPRPGLPRYIRATSNPGGRGHSWVFKRWGAWLNPEFVAPGLKVRFDDAGRKLPPIPPGRTAWILRVGDVEHYVKRGTEGARSRTFIPAALRDNPHLTRNDPDYHSSLANLNKVRREQLASGNWLIRSARGLYFKREYWQLTPERRPAVMRIRYWDRAATEEQPGTDPDYTAGLLMALHADGTVTIEDVVRGRWNPGDVAKIIRTTAAADGLGVIVGLEQDPGSAGKSEAHFYASYLRGFNVRFFIPSGDKATRAGPVSAQAEAKNVYVWQGGRFHLWFNDFTAECEEFPDDAHDDQVDALSGAFSALFTKRVTRHIGANVVA